MADATYQPKIYKTQGGAELVVTSSGTLTLEGTLAAASGAIVSYAAGSYFKYPIQTLTSTQTATNATNFGLTVLTATTTGPTYTLAAPVVGLTKFLNITHSSSGVTHRAVLRSNTTGVSFDTTGGNQITFATSATRGVTLVAQTTAIWKIVGVYTGASIAAARTT